jgi:hypothetical protein
MKRADVTISIEFSARSWPKPLVMQQQFVGARRSQRRIPLVAERAKGAGEGRGIFTG